MNKFISTPLITVLLLAFLLTACDDSQTVFDPNEEEQTIVDVAASNDDFSILVDAVVQAGLDGALSSSGPFTVFAPTNSAFEALPAGLLESLTDQQLSEILQYHVLSVEVLSNQLEAEQSVASLTGENIFVTTNSNGVTINNAATVITADIEASNGVIHAIDRVILPDGFGDVVDNASKRYFLDTLVETVAAMDLVGTLQGEGPWTVFAPTNEAFDAISDVIPTLTPEQITDILLYHVLPTRALSTDLTPGDQTITAANGDPVTVNLFGDTVTVNGTATVQIANINGTNGVIHVIDSVLLPPSE